MITNTNQINDQQLHELNQLAAFCKQHDGSIPNLYTHILIKHRNFPATLLYYHKGKLVGFLSCYFFYDDAVEISLLIHPSHRRKGLAKALLEAIVPLLCFQNYFTLIFSSPTEVNTSWFLTKNYTYMHSEYHMEREGLHPILDFKHPLIIEQATINDIPKLCELDSVCFPQKQGDLIGRFHHLLNTREYEILLAYYHKKPIGKAHLRWQTHGVTLSDIAILPPFQGKGMGTTLIAHCINLALSEGLSTVNLDVETHNQRALALYTRLGFSIQNACDYWSIDIDTLFQEQRCLAKN